MATETSGAAENVVSHHEYCDTRDPIIRTKPCNCPPGWPRASAGAYVVSALIGGEYSGQIRDALLARGVKALSCDLLDTEVPGPHYRGDLFDVIDYPWDLAIFHPSCTDLAVSGARHFAAKWADGRQAASVAFFMRVARRSSHIPRVAIENPVSIISSLWRKPDCIVQPWQHGHGETKATCWWLKGLPPLVPSNVVEGRADRIHKMPPSPDRWKERSRTLPGVAKAIAEQWGRAA